MLRFLLDEHTGWSTIVSRDFKLKPGYTNAAQRPEGMSYDEFSQLPINRRPQCYCHGHRKEDGFIADHTTDCGASWAYVFEVVPERDGEPEQNILHILDREKNEDGNGYHWQEVGRVALDSEEKINWDAIECGENFERCGHYAWHHGLAPKTCNLSTQTLLGKRPLDMHDVVAVIVNGKTWKLSGSAGDSDYINRTNFRFHPEVKPFPPSTWVATCVSKNGRRVELPIAYRTEKGFIPYDGVQWVFPETKGTSGQVVSR
jgi:hypothetical protein